jgi:hypothetical protein
VASRDEGEQPVLLDQLGQQQDEVRLDLGAWHRERARKEDGGEPLACGDTERIGIHQPAAARVHEDRAPAQLTPHIAGSSEQAVVNMRVAAARNVLEVLAA